MENLALRQQLAALVAKGQRPHITGVDRWFWVTLRRFWSRWTEALIIVKPETVVHWHRAGFRRYWTWLSRRRRPGRPRAKESLRVAVRRIARENPGWGVPRIHGELLMLGFVASESTVSRYMPRRRGQPGAVNRWLTFLHNHRSAIAGMDFFVVPTATFRLLYAWFMRREVQERPMT
jgi:putative transposase